jgi:apolipoprotein N-acyltransferase
MSADTFEVFELLPIIFRVAGIVFAIGSTIWIFKDAEFRGKSGIAAGLLAFLSFFYGFFMTIMVLCVWVLYRPEKLRRTISKAESSLPKKFPAYLVASPASKGLEEND